MPKISSIVTRCNIDINGDTVEYPADSVVKLSKGMMTISPARGPRVTDVLRAGDTQCNFMTLDSDGFVSLSSTTVQGGVVTEAHHTLGRVARGVSTKTKSISSLALLHAHGDAVVNAEWECFKGSFYLLAADTSCIAIDCADDDDHVGPVMETSPYFDRIQVSTSDQARIEFNEGVGRLLANHMVVKTQGSGVVRTSSHYVKKLTAKLIGLSRLALVKVLDKIVFSGNPECFTGQVANDAVEEICCVNGRPFPRSGFDKSDIV